jgi:predicted Zn-dependent protease
MVLDPARALWRRPLAILIALELTLVPPGAPPSAVAESDAAAGGANPLAQPFKIDRGKFDVGLEVALAVAQEVGLVEDEATMTRIYDLGSRVAMAAGDPNTVMTFHLVAMDEANAFAVPGGFLFVTQGLLDLELGDDALAHLLGHEIAHVRKRHHDRMGTWDAISSLVHTAVMIGLAIGATSASGNASRTVDEYGVERVQLGGQAALLEGTAVFGSVFRELFLRGFSRKLENEADEEGSTYATRAGFAPAGGVELLETLHRRIFEQSGYAYWRTHPYFNDRVIAARARSGQSVGRTDSTAVAAYRLRVQSTLAREAREREGSAAELLYRSAVRSGPGTGAAAAVELEIVRFRAAREQEKPVLSRRLGPIAAGADSAIARLEGKGAAGADLDSLKAERARLDGALASNLPQVLEVIDSAGAASNAALELFIDNYPRHSRAGAVRLALARRHLRQGRPEAAAPLLTALITRSPADSLRQTGETELTRAIDQLTDPSVCYAVLDSAPDSAIARQARTRMETLVAGIDSLEVGGRFLKRWPDSPYTGEVKARVGTLATDTARFARVYEVGGKPQQALDLYNRVVLLAPGTEAAAEALRGIERIQRIEES